MIPVILDTDLAMGAPGSDVDDGFALAMAVADPDIDLRLVTTVDGNTDVDTATALSHDLLRRLARTEIPVARGASRPLAAGAEPSPAVAAIIELVLAAPGEITLVAIGPLTNVASAIRAEPRFVSALAQLVIMGGKFTGGVLRPEMPGEFNVWSDPEAAQVVLDAPITARWVGLDVTEQVRLSRADAEEMAGSANEFEAFAGEYSIGWIDHVTATEGASDSCALHDPLAVAVVTRPELVTFRSVRVAVELGAAERGLLTVEESAEPNASIGVTVDAEGFRAHFRELLAR